MNEANAEPFSEIPGFDRVSELLEKGVRDGVFPGAVVLVGRRGKVIYRQSVGFKTLKSPKVSDPARMGLDTVFDLAALSTIVVTTTLLMKLVESSKVKLTDRVARYAQGFGVLGKSSITVGQLLSHSSGLAQWVPFFEELLEIHSGARRGILTSRGAREYIYTAINRSQLKYEPGTRQVFSDVGFILLGHLLEVLTGLGLDKAAQRFVFQPLGLKSTSYVDLSMIRRRGIHPVTDLIAPTEECAWRKRVLCGEVHDDNAWVMGGIAGHSGLFSTAGDLHLFAAEMLSAYRGESSFFKPYTVRLFWRGPSEFPEGWRYGWDSPSRENGMLDCGLSASAVGQNGFTGCSLWLEPDEAIDVVFMSNRINPSRMNKKILAFRPELHQLILEAARKI